MKLEIEFSQVETALLKIEFEQNFETLAEKWNVSSFEDFIELLTMHGLDNLKDISG